MQIERVEIQVIGPETERYTWSDDLPEQYQSNTLLRVYTDAGLEQESGTRLLSVTIATPPSRYATWCRF